MYQQCILDYFVRDIKLPILFPPIFSTIFSPALAPEKGSKLFIGPKLVFLSFGPMKSLFSFSIAQTKKNSWKKLGKTRLVAWWFDVTNKIYILATVPFRDVAKLAFIHNSVIAVVATRVMQNMEKFAADFVYSKEIVMKQGNSLRGIENRTVRRQGILIIYLCSLLSNAQFIRKQNCSKLQFLS